MSVEGDLGQPLSEQSSEAQISRRLVGPDISGSHLPKPTVEQAVPVEAIKAKIAHVSESQLGQEVQQLLNKEQQNAN